jgi:hypothetical protein
MICHNMPGVYCAVVLPRELDADSYAVLLHLSEEVILLVSSELVLAGDQMHLHIACLIHRLEDGFEEVHQVLGLVEVSNIGVCHYDLRRASKVWTEELVKANSFLILLYFNVTFLRSFNLRLLILLSSWGVLN